MTPRTLCTGFLAIGFAAVAAWAWPTGSTVLRADPPPPGLDSDNDFLPDEVEWACLTSAQSPDTDSDGTSDFVEVVQRGNPRQPNGPLPPDHEMRIVVTSNPTAQNNEVTLHLLFRFMGDTTLLSNIDVWAEIGAAEGFRFPLTNFASGPITIDQRFVPSEGLWVRVSAPMVSEAILRAVLPCTIGADALIGSRSITTKVPVIDRSGITSTLVPYGGPALFAVQSIGALTATTDLLVNNRICVLQLESVGDGSGGSTFQITGAECQDCNDLQCGVGCAASVGTVIVLPGGPGSITGG